MALIDPGSHQTMGKRVRNAFQAAYRRPPSVVGRAPGRVNLIGEHTDYNRGLCLPLALPHATYAAAAARPDDRVNLISAQASSSWQGSVTDLGPGRVTDWVAYVAGVLWALREDGIDVPGVDLAIDSTVPLGAGLSSSAAVECAVAMAVAALVGLELDEPLRRRLVAACIRAEAEVAGAPTGGMDQTVALHASPGAALLIDFEDQTHRPVPLPLEDAGLTLLVTDTRVSHSLADGGYAARRADCERAAAESGVDSLRDVDSDQLARLADRRIQRRARHVVSEIRRVDRVVDAVEQGDWTTVGRLFDSSHASMRDDFEISCAELDLSVETAVQAGALAARMTGGGFGGSSVAVVPRDRLDAVVRAVDTAFAAHGFRPPAHLRAVPGAAAGVIDQT